MDEGGAVGEQEGGELGDLLRTAEAPGRVQGDEVVAGRPVGVAQQGRVDESRADGVDAYVPGRVLERRGLGEADDTVLGGRVRRGVREAVGAEDVDDMLTTAPPPEARMAGIS